MLVAGPGGGRTAVGAPPGSGVVYAGGWAVAVSWTVTVDREVVGLPAMQLVATAASNAALASPATPLTLTANIQPRITDEGKEDRGIAA
jgi:hypothetical protein